MQRRLDQPLLVYAAKDFATPPAFDSSALTALDADNSLLGFMHSQLLPKSDHTSGNVVPTAAAPAPRPPGQGPIVLERPPTFTQLVGRMQRQAHALDATATQTEETNELFSEPNFVANDYFKHASHLKTSVFAVGTNKVLLRV